ncbi:MAG: iron ABC transporter permease [Bacteroidales bacterium]|nr:iron ABC transporter permease [Bacteroidales bacterium]
MKTKNQARTLRQSSHANPLTLALLALLLLAAMCGSCMVGAVDFSWGEVWHSAIFLQLRLPRVLMSVVVGAVLSVCGAAYQSIFRNPLTDPYVLGVSSGASLGAAVAILLGLEAYLWGVGGMALAAALATVWLIYRIASIGNRMHTTTLLLTGVCLTLLISAAISFLMVMNQEKMDSIIFWTMGSFASAGWSDVAVVTPVAVAGIGVVLYHARELNLLLAGSEAARSMGVEVERLKRTLLLFTTLMVAFAVSASGVIGFVGLIVPHAVRLVAGPDNRRVVPYSMLCGALFVLVCDTLARCLLRPSELPVGSLTSMVGAPLFIYLLYKNKRSY